MNEIATEIGFESVSNGSDLAVIRDLRKVRLAFLDGMRGLAAFYVALFHCHMKAADLPARSVGSSLSPWFNWLNYGHYSVCVFIVLSGFVLMLPCTKSPVYALKGGFLPFMKRRFLRIFPPYWAALFLSIALVELGVKLHLHSNNVTFGDMWSHFLMVHNLNSRWSTSIDGSMWSVGVEWDIYILFGLMLLPFVRSFGYIATNIFSLAIGLVIEKVLPSVSTPWFISLFAMGMSGAILCSDDRPQKKQEQLSKLCLGIVIFSLAGVALLFFLPGGSVQGLWPSDFLVGLCTASFIVYYALTADRASRSLLGRILENRYVAGFGIISYSFYLTHQILLYGFDLVIRKKLTGNLELLALIACLPVVVGFSYLFYLAFEKRFATSSRSPLVPATAVIVNTITS